MIDKAPGIAVVPVRTPTLPPATHTNTWIVGEGRLSVFDPASPWDDQQQLLAASLAERIDRGETVERLVLTHHHHDHVGGAIALRNWLADRGIRAPIVAHPQTAELLQGVIPIDEPWVDAQVVDCGGRQLQGVHTPGHAPGHLVFQDAESAAMIAGDMVAGIGTIAISPEDGDLGQYLASLQAMIDRKPSVLLPAHGDPLRHPEQLLSFYIAHRHGRTDQFRDALQRLGTATPLEIATEVYADEIDARFLPLAAMQVISHLRWMRDHGLATPIDGEARWRA